MYVHVHVVAIIIMVLYVTSSVKTCIMFYEHMQVYCPQYWQ